MADAHQRGLIVNVTFIHAFSSRKASCVSIQYTKRWLGESPALEEACSDQRVCRRERCLGVIEVGWPKDEASILQFTASFG